MHGVMKLLFIRHAQSTGNQEKRMQGHGEFELSELGKQQAEKLARRLLIEAWWPSQVYSSPLKRAAQTTQILVDHFLAAPLPAAVSDLIDATVAVPADVLEEGRSHSISVQFADELKEFQNGIFQGLTWAEAVRRYPDLCQALEASPDWIPIPGAETLQDARSQVACYWREVGGCITALAPLRLSPKKRKLLRPVKLGQPQLLHPPLLPPPLPIRLQKPFVWLSARPHQVDRQNLQPIG